MQIIHKGHALNQAQLDAIVPVFNEVMKGHHKGRKKLEEAIDKALLEAGCPVPATPDSSDVTAHASAQ
ncbi:TPA: hypothetical protein ACKRQV_001229 [Pseudomonas aeruginosa]|nr:hypothetical protein [Pseudomonas aeruginosa]EIU2864422.1 hypothetical protein [Pseudomonas aeruginosa]